MISKYVWKVWNRILFWSNWLLDALLARLFEELQLPQRSPVTPIMGLKSALDWSNLIHGHTLRACTACKRKRACCHTSAHWILSSGVLSCVYLLSWRSVWASAGEADGFVFLCQWAILSLSAERPLLWSQGALKTNMVPLCRTAQCACFDTKILTTAMLTVFL